MSEDPICPACGFGCGVRRCKPAQISDICCDDCPENVRYQRIEKAHQERMARNREIWLEKRKAAGFL